MSDFSSSVCGSRRTLPNRSEGASVKQEQHKCNTSVNMTGDNEIIIPAAERAEIIHSWHFTTHALSFNKLTAGFQSPSPGLFSLLLGEPHIWARSHTLIYNSKRQTLVNLYRLKFERKPSSHPLG